jgi:hypothetical protein
MLRLFFNQHLILNLTAVWTVLLQLTKIHKLLSANHANKGVKFVQALLHVYNVLLKMVLFCIIFIAYMGRAQKTFIRSLMKINV